MFLIECTLLLTLCTVSRKGSSGNATLSFNIDAGDDCETTQTGQFGLFVPDLGERYGAQSPITATKGQAWPHFYVTNGQVEPQRTAASQLWYGMFDIICLVTCWDAMLTCGRSLQHHRPRPRLLWSQLGSIQLERELALRMRAHFGEAGFQHSVLASERSCESQLRSYSHTYSC